MTRHPQDSVGTVVLLGGTGAIGRYTAAELSALGYEVYVTTRRAGPLAGLGLPPEVRVLHGDAMDDAFVKECARRVGHVDALIDFMVYSTSRFAARMDTLLGLAEQYVFLSSARVYAPSSDTIRESSPRLLDVSNDSKYLRTDEYALAKARQEDLLGGSGRRNWTVVRPSLTFAANRLQFGAVDESVWLWRAARGLPVAVPDCVVERVTTMTWAGDTGAILARLVRNPRALADVFQIAGDQALSWRGIAEIYAESVDLVLDVVPERRYFRFAGATAQVMLARAVDRRFDSSKVLEAVGGHSFGMLRDTLAQELDATDLGSIRPDIGKNGAMDALTGTRCGLSRGVGRARVRYFMGRYPTLRETAELVRGRRVR